MSIKIISFENDLDSRNDLGNLESMMDIGKDNDADLIVFPEAFFIFKGDDEVNKAVQRVLDHGIPTVFGFIKGDINGAYILTPEDEPRIYRKRCLYADEKTKFTSGTTPLSFRVKDYVVAPLICYDLFFPEIMRAQTLSENVDLYLVLATIKKEQKHFWESLITTRSIENSVSIVTSNNYSDTKGILHGTFYYEPHGSFCFPEAGEEFVNVDVHPERFRELRNSASPNVNARELFSEGIYGPYLKDISAD